MTRRSKAVEPRIDSQKARTSTKRPAALARYTTGEGEQRMILTLRLQDRAVLVIDCASSGAEPRLVGRIEPDEPAENAQLLARLYLEDEQPRCGQLRRSDIHDAHAMPR